MAQNQLRVVEDLTNAPPSASSKPRKRSSKTAKTLMVHLKKDPPSSAPMVPPPSPVASRFRTIFKGFFYVATTSVLFYGLTVYKKKFDQKIEKDIKTQVASDLATLESKLSSLKPSADIADPTIRTQLTDLKESLKALYVRVGKLEERRAADQERQSTGHVNLSPIHNQLGVFQASIARLDETITRLGVRVGAIEHQFERRREFAEKSSQFLYHLHGLQKVLNTDKPFRGELTQFASYVNDIPELDQWIRRLEPWASAGIPLLATIQADFSTLAHHLLQDGAGGGVAASSLIVMAKQKIKEFISFRHLKSDGTPASSLESILDDVEKTLAQGNVAAALDIFERYDSKNPMAQEWRKKAHARALADRVLMALQRMDDPHYYLMGAGKK